MVDAREVASEGEERPTFAVGPAPSTDDDEFAKRRGFRHRRAELRVIAKPADDEGGRALDRAVLLAVYGEACSAWRMLTDVRFKLLALLPAVAALGLVAVVSSAGPAAGLGRGPRVGLALFGLVVTIGLRVYDRRNDELYDDLIGVARRAEVELGVHAGVFLGRPGRQDEWPGKLVRHGTATFLVYWAVIVAWVAAATYAWWWL